MILLIALSRGESAVESSNEVAKKSLTTGAVIEIYLKLRYNLLIMRESQWVIFGIGFFILGMIFIGISLQWGAFCSHNFVENPIPCIRQQVFSVFPYIFFLLGVVCFINSAIESSFKKKK